MKKQTSPKNAFSLVELLTVVTIIGVLAAIATPIYTRYIRSSKTSEAISNLGTISMFEETYFSENSSYVSAAENPSGNIPGESNPGGRKYFSTGVAGWGLLGRVMPDNSPLIFQYEVRAGQFDSAGASVTGGTGNLVAYTSAKSPGIGCNPALSTYSASSLAIPNVNSSNWFYVTAVGNQKPNGSSAVCSLFIKVIDRMDVFRQNPIE